MKGIDAGKRARSADVDVASGDASVATDVGGGAVPEEEEDDADRIGGGGGGGGVSGVAEGASDDPPPAPPCGVEAGAGAIFAFAFVFRADMNHSVGSSSRFR